MITEGAILDIARDAIYTIIQAQTLTFVPKILGIFVTMLICGSWMLNNMTSLIERLWSNFSYYLSLG